MVRWSLLLCLARVIGAIRLDAKTLRAWVHTTAQAALEVRVTNDSSEPIDVALSFNQTFSTDATAVPSPGRTFNPDVDPIYDDPRSVRSHSPDHTKVIDDLFRQGRGIQKGPASLIIPIRENKDRIRPIATHLIDCLKMHGRDCQYTAWRSGSKCLPKLRVLSNIGLVVLDYNEVLTQCTPEDVEADLKFLEKYLTVETIELDRVLEHDFELETLTLEPGLPQRRSGGNPNDPMFPDQDHLAFVNITEAWAEIGEWPKHFKPVVAVIDTGVQGDHEDLRENLWVNEAELHGLPGVDDDGNGYVDDIYGWLPGENGAQISNDHQGHGTHVIGILAATTNNGVGVSSVAGPNVRAASCNYFHGPFGGTLYAIAECRDWALAIKAHLTSNSYAADSTKWEAIWMSEKKPLDAQLEARQLSVMAAGNRNSNFGPPGSPFYSWNNCFNYAHMVTVTNVDERMGEHCCYTNWGENCATIGAPGRNLLATYDSSLPWSTGAKYGRMTGTSMATPVVSGIVALWLNVNPYLDAFESKRLLRESAVHNPALARPATLFGGVPDPVKGIRLLRPQTLKPADGSRWDDYRFNLRRLAPGESTSYFLTGLVPGGVQDDVLGDVISYDVDFKDNYAVRAKASATVVVHQTHDSLDGLETDDFNGDLPPTRPPSTMAPPTTMTTTPTPTTTTPTTTGPTTTAPTTTEPTTTTPTTTTATTTTTGTGTSTTTTTTPSEGDCDDCCCCRKRCH